MVPVFEALFWLFLTTVFYAYAGYPLVLWVWSVLNRKPVNKGFYEPSVSVILSAFNEEKAIEAKLKNLLSQDYPAEKLEILVGSDGGSDKTDEIVSSFRSSRVRFFRFVQNLGKPHVLNALVKEARGSVLVFTDARQEFEHEAIRKLVENFNDPEIGCVSGELFFKEDRHSCVGQGIDAYWRYEKFLRRKESEIGSMLGATGAIYAVRRALFPVLPVQILVDDMYAPLAIVKKGYRAIFESEARAFDRPSRETGEEFKRKVRTLAGNYQIVASFPELLNPLQSSVAFQLFSHKVLRLAIPFVLLSLLVTNFLLLEQNNFYAVFFIAQLVFYGLAVLEMLSAKLGSGRKSIGYIPFTFCLLNYCAFVGFLRFLKGTQKITWERAYA